VTAYLADTSIWGWAASGRRPDIEKTLAERFESDLVLTSPPIVLEALHGARNGREYEALYASLFQPVRWLPASDESARRAVVVQRELAHRTHGNHLRPAADFLIAAIAEAAGADVTLWFLDRDLRIICEHTGQPYEAERAR
jgi:predicted nucleic acid-binding protein